MKLRNKNLLAGDWLIAPIFALVTFGSQVIADDTDIYINIDTDANTEKPMIMLSLDYRANLGNTVCWDDEDTPATPCGQLVDELYLDDDAIRNPDPVNELGKYSSLEIYRAVLKKVMDHELTPAITEVIDGETVITPAVTVKDAALFGFMMNHYNSAGGPGGCDGGPDETDCSNGGFILSKFRDLGDPTVDPVTGLTNYDFFFNNLENIPIPQTGFKEVSKYENKSKNVDNPHGCPVPGNTGEHSYQGSELFFEFFRYLTGQDIHNGHLGFEDFGNRSGANINDAPDLPLPISQSDLHCKKPPTWDPQAQVNPSDVRTGKYVSPLTGFDADSCGADVYTFNFMFNVSNQETETDCEILQSRALGGMDGIAGSECAVDASGAGGEFETVIEYLYDADLGVEAEDGDPFGTVPGIPGKQNVISYFFIPTSQATNNKTSAYARAGGTIAPIAMDLEDIDVTLDSIIGVLEQILSVSATFVSPVLPSNVFNRTDLLNQVYIAIFQADQEKRPAWTGNLKRLAINADDPTNPFLAGSDGGDPAGIANIPAVGPDGRIDPGTLTFWTYAADIPAPGPGNLNPDFALGSDGRSTVHGGAGGVIPGYRAYENPDLNEPGETNAIGTTDYDTNRAIFTEPDDRPSGTAVAMRAFNANVNTAEEFLEIGDGSVDPLPFDDYADIKIDLWRTIMPYKDC
jgi:type IV pilus assembly protein PilY1